MGKLRHKKLSILPKAIQLVSSRVGIEITSSLTPDPKLPTAHQFKTTKILHHKMKMSMFKFSRSMGWMDQKCQYHFFLQAELYQMGDG